MITGKQHAFENFSWSSYVEYTDCRSRKKLIKYAAAVIWVRVYKLSRIDKDGLYILKVKLRPCNENVRIYL